MSVHFARQEAGRLIEALKIWEAPVDVARIAKNLGLKIIQQNLGDNVSGLLVRTSAGTHICVAAGHAEVRRRFTIAHEIGHHVLRHQFEAGAHVHVDRGNYISQRGIRASEGVDPKEIEANQFAACLLMPVNVMQAAVKRLASGTIFDGDVEELARLFKVSEQAMTIRLTTLGLL
jgi:Zn-dependent peptidase ImmA (M78 family)